MLRPTLVRLAILAALLVALVFSHELGHYVVMRQNGVGVAEVSVGLGPRLFQVQRGETTWSLRLLLLAVSLVQLHAGSPRSSWVSLRQP